MNKIMIDIGHGGSDPGAKANGLVEKDINLIVGLLIGDELKPFDCEVKFSRTTDITLSADNRVAIVKNYNPDLCVSVHHNYAAIASARGAEVIHAHYDTQDDLLASDILKRLAAIGMPTRRAFTKLNERGSDWYYMIRLIWDNDTDAIITEGGFLSNSFDVLMLSNNDYLKAEAKAIAGSIVTYLKLQPKAKPTERILKQGCKGDDVKDLQQKLKNLGYVMATDGIFGPGTKKCVIEFQKLNGLSSDGIVGAMTRARLAIAKPIPYQVLQYNKYIRIIKIRKTSILKCDVVDSVGAKETVKSMFARVKPTIMINGGLYGMSNGVSLSKFFNSGKKITDGVFSDFSFVVDKNGKPSFKYVRPGEPVENDALGASPSLIINGIKVIDKKGLEKDFSFIGSMHPRMAIGEDDEYIYIICVQGRKLLLGYIGMTINALAVLGIKLKLKNFMNVDGGGSSIAIGPDGKPLNDPLENRAVDNGIAFWLMV
jgi:N-acetylmuramoyl-L-alanine amidase